MRLGVIADDFTGATDIAGFLVANGMRTIQVNGPPPDALRAEADAVVVSLKSRSTPPELAVADSLAALEWLLARDCPQVFFKYCSTFDSTQQGNIGPVTDALLAALKETFTVICPALPINGRTIYKGYLFVDDVPLDESGMRHHPITPMQDANLMRLMDAQAQGRSGNVPVEVIGNGAEAIRTALADLKASGCRYAVLDAIEDTHLSHIGAAISDMRLVTGGSGLADGLARTWDYPRTADASNAGLPLPGPTAILSGSCSIMTNRQVVAYRQDTPALAVDVGRAVAGVEDYANEIADWVLARQAEGASPLVYASTDAETLAATQDRYGAESSSMAVERLLSQVAKLLVAAGTVRLIVAGGETSGAVVKAIGVPGFHIGPQIVPGVPWVRAIDQPLSLALKSGNFGGEDFFSRAQAGV